MSNQGEWLLLEAEDDIDEVMHRHPTEEYLFYQAVIEGDIDTVKKNCEQGRFLDSDGVGVLSRDPVTNLKYHFVITTAMLTRLCRQRGMELEQAYRLSDFYIQKLDDIHTVKDVHILHDEMVMDYTKKCAEVIAEIQILHISTNARNIFIRILKSALRWKIWHMSWEYLPVIYHGCLRKRQGIP